MTTLYKWCITLVVCALVATHGVAQTVAITSSQEDNSGYKMDEVWRSVSIASGYIAEIHPSTFLSHPDLRSKTDLLIISNGTGSIDPTYRPNILKYIRGGGHLYIQSEYLSSFDGNELFKYLLDKTGSAFEWGGQSDNNIGPMNIINGFETGLDNNTLDYFWYGTYGCGDGQVNPFIEVGGENYAFYYRSVNATIGNIITNSDHDWIRRIDDNRAPREALMSKIIDVLLNGQTNINYQHPTIALQENIDFCSDNSISVEINNSNNPNIQWYLNGAAADVGMQMDITNLTDGDSLYAELIIHSGCVETKSISETIIVSRQNHDLVGNSSFIEIPPICPGAEVRIDITYDTSAPNIRHNWFLNGRDTPIKTDYFISDNLSDGDIIEHTLTYSNGCDDITIQTTGSVNIQWKDISIPNIQINGQSTFCSPTIASLELPELNVEKPTIQWYVDNTVEIENKSFLDVEASDIPKEVFATIKYYNNCTGWVTISTPVVYVSIQELEIYLGEKANHDCEHGEGFIEVYSNHTDINYNWSNGATGNYISNLSEGTFTVTGTSSIGCTATESYEISKLIFPLLDSIEIYQPHCNEGNGKVQLNLADNNLDDINIRWIDNLGNIIHADQGAATLVAGEYQVILDVNGNCEEKYEIKINKYDDSNRNKHLIIDTVIVEIGEVITLRPNMTGSEGHTIEWQSNPNLSCTNCINPEIISSVNHLFKYSLKDAHGCKVQKAVLVLVKIREPFYAPSAFSPNNDGINDYYKIKPRSDVFPTSSLLIFDRWGSLIHEEQSDTRGWDGKSSGRHIQKGIYVFVQNFEDTKGKKYIAKGSVTVF